MDLSHRLRPLLALLLGISLVGGCSMNDSTSAGLLQGCAQVP